MRRFKTRSKQRRRRRGLALLAIGVLFLVAVFSPATHAKLFAWPEKLAAPRVPVSNALAPNTSDNVQPQSQFFRDNLTVKRGQVYENNVSVYDGDVTVESGGTILGNLYVYSGDVTVEEGGKIQGDIAAFSGNVEVAGDIGGRIVAWSGNVQLGDGSTVGGDVSVLSGDIEQAPGARIHGNIVRGPNFKIPVPSIFQAPAAVATPELHPAEVQRPARPGFFGTLFGFMLRMLGAALLTVIVAVLAWLLYNVQPDLVRKVRRAAEEQLALSFAVGAIVNVGLLFVTFIFFVTVCLIPLGLATGLGLVLLNLVGWSAMSLWIGERLSRYGRNQAQPVTYMILGVLVTAGAVGILWALGCWRTCVMLIILLISAPGVGALLIPWLKLGPQYGAQRNPPTPSAPNAPVRPTAPIVPPASVEPVTPMASTETLRPTPNSEVVAPSEPPVSTPPAPPVDEQRLSEITGLYEPAPAEESPSTPPVASDLAAGMTPVVPISKVEPVDFTRIKGIGPTFDRRLKDAGIRTFGQLAMMTPEAIAAIIGWSPELVSSDDVIGQARALAEQA